MIKRWVYVALAFGLGMSAMSCENQKFNDVKVDVTGYMSMSFHLK